MPKALRHTLLAVAIGALPLVAAAQTHSMNTAPPSTTPSTAPSTNSMQNNTMRQADNSGYGQAIAACDKKPMSERTACRQAADSQFGKGGGETAANTTSGNSTAAGNPGTAGAASAPGAAGSPGSSSGMGTSGTGTSGTGSTGTGTSGTTGGTGSAGAGGGTGSGTGK